MTTGTSIPASFTTAAVAGSTELLRTSTQAPSGQETPDVTIAARTQAQPSPITPAPPNATEKEPHR